MGGSTIIYFAKRAKGTSQTEPRSATLVQSDLELALAEGTLNIQDLAARASAIADPGLRGQAREAILDLALTKDGRTSFKNQGKWGHGFIPLDEKAKRAKAKGSSIAMQRMNRLYGGARRKQKKFQGDNKPVTVETDGGNMVTAKDASRVAVAGAKAPDIGHTQRVKNSQFEKNKVGRVEARATRAWDDIPDTAKTVRDGKRYVVSTYKGEQVLTEWQGGVDDIDAENTTLQKTLTAADAADMTTAELRRLLKDPKAGKQAKQMAYKALQAKLKSGAIK